MKEMHRARYVGIGEWHVEIPCPLWAHHPSTLMHSPTWKLPNLFLMVRIEECHGENANNSN